MLKMHPVWRLGAPSRWLLHPSDLCSSLYQHFLVAKKKDLSSSYTYPVPGPESVIISKEFILFSAEWHLKAKTWVIGVLVAIRYHCSQALSKNPARKYMYPLSSTGDVQSLVPMKQTRLNISRIS